jgi:hypothetical protein
MERSLSGDAGAIKRAVDISIQRGRDLRHHPDDPGPAPPVSFSSSIMKQRLFQAVICCNAVVPGAVIAAVPALLFFNARQRGVAGNPL